MAPVPHAAPAGQALAFLDNPRAAFVLLVEAGEAFADLDAVAADALRSPARRKLTRSEARRRYRRARAVLAWLGTMSAAPPPAAPAPESAPGWEGWCE